MCLSKCRSPLGFLLGSWRDGLRGALSMGARHGAWCVGCCWALMASLFALGVMSLAWMAFVAALIALEKTLPWGRPATYATAAILLVLGVALIAAPDAVPGLTIPGGGMDAGAHADALDPAACRRDDGQFGAPGVADREAAVDCRTERVHGDGPADLAHRPDRGRRSVGGITDALTHTPGGYYGPATSPTLPTPQDLS